MITVYTSAACPQCTATKRDLDRRGIEYTARDVREDEQAAIEVQAYPYKALPIVVAGEDHWSGFRPDLIKALGGGE